MVAAKPRKANVSEGAARRANAPAMARECERPRPRSLTDTPAVPGLLPSARMKADLPKLAALEDEGAIFDDLNPAPRLLMGPGPINADPRVLKALGDAAHRPVRPAVPRLHEGDDGAVPAGVRDANRWTLLVDGTARAGDRVRDGLGWSSRATACSCSSFGRFGQLLTEIARRGGADVRVIEVEWGTVFPPEQVEDASEALPPKLVAVCQGDTSTTMAQPLEEIGELCQRYGALIQVDATATLGGMPLPVDAWRSTA